VEGHDFSRADKPCSQRHPSERQRARITHRLRARTAVRGSIPENQGRALHISRNALVHQERLSTRRLTTDGFLQLFNPYGTIPGMYRQQIPPAIHFPVKAFLAESAFHRHRNIQRDMTIARVQIHVGGEVLW